MGARERRPGARCAQRLPLRTGQGRRAPRPLPQARSGIRHDPAVLQPHRRAGRARLRWRLDRHRTEWHRDGPSPAVRRGSARCRHRHREPLPYRLGHLTSPRIHRGGLLGTRHGPARLCGEERVLVRHPRTQRWYRLRPRGSHQCRCPRTRARPRCGAAQCLLIGPLRRRRLRPRRPHRDRHSHDPDCPDGGCLSVLHGAQRTGGGEPPGPSARDDPDGPVERRRSPRPGDRQQE